MATTWCSPWSDKAWVGFNRRYETRHAPSVAQIGNLPFRRLAVGRRRRNSGPGNEPQPQRAAST
jgi:hypothetical protein